MKVFQLLKSQVWILIMIFYNFVEGFEIIIEFNLIDKMQYFFNGIVNYVIMGSILMVCKLDIFFYLMDSYVCDI